MLSLLYGQENTRPNHSLLGTFSPGPVPAVLPEQSVSLPTDFSFPWDQLAPQNPGFDNTATQVPFSLPFTPNSALIPNAIAPTPEAVASFMGAMMAQPALVQLWAQQNGLYGAFGQVPQFAQSQFQGMGIPHHLSAMAPSQTDLSSTFHQLSPAAHLTTNPSTHFHSPVSVGEAAFMASATSNPTMPVVSGAPSSSIQPFNGVLTSLPSSVISTASDIVTHRPATTIAIDQNVLASQSTSCTTPVTTSNPVGTPHNSIPARISPAASQATPDSVSVRILSQTTATHELSMAVQPTSQTVRFAPDAYGGSEPAAGDAPSAGALSTAASDTTSTTRPQRHRRVPANPDGTRPINLPGLRASSANGNGLGMDGLVEVGTKRKRAGSGAEPRKRKSV